MRVGYKPGTVTEQLLERTLAKIQEARGRYHRLVLVVGPPRSGKTKILQDIARTSQIPFISVNLELGRRLLDLTERQRVLGASAQLSGIVAAYAREVVLLDNLEILFEVSLQQDPLRLLQQLARGRIVVAAWNGHVRERDLTYAAPGHPEFRRYPTDGLLVVSAEAG